MKEVSMETYTLEMLHTFILRAKRASYVGGGQKLLSYRLGSHDLQYFDSDWAYHDSYLGDSDFIGEEAVYFRQKVVWAMNYFGRILAPDYTSAEAGALIKTSLTKMYNEGRFLGGFQIHQGNYTYVDTSEGDLQYFTGREWITRESQKVYELVYHGGLVK
jgi:hypothetical protein